MSAAINFFGGISSINNLAGSGLAFFGVGGFGAAIPVGSWQGRTFISDGNGVSQGPEVWNTQFLNAASGILGQVGTGIALTAFPNSQATLNVRFTYDVPVKTQNASIRIYDRTTITNPASGITTKMAQLIHPDPSQSNNGSGDASWTTDSTSGVVNLLNLCPCPGVSGLFAGNGANSTHTDTQHDYYVVLSCSPNTIGSKNLYGLYTYVEYL